MDQGERAYWQVRAYWPLITAEARLFGLPPGILAGLVAQESAGQTWATRPEPYYKWVFGRRARNLPLLKRLLPRWRTPKQDFYVQRISFGLCQVMGAVARELGLEGYLTQLCDPYLGLHYGAKYLAWCLRRAKGNMKGALLKYNGGGDKDYPAKVFGWAEKFKKAGGDN